MKKIFLLIGVAAFTSAAAQQKDVFDIQQHLQKKKTDANEAIKQKNLLLPFLQPKPGSETALPKSGDTYILSNGDIVIYGNGSMPWIKPDMRQFQIMPDAAKSELISGLLSPGNKFGQIPNGAIPYRRFFIK